MRVKALIRERVAYPRLALQIGRHVYQPQPRHAGKFFFVQRRESVPVVNGSGGNLEVMRAYQRPFEF